MKAAIARYWAIPLLQRLFVGAAWSVAGSGLTRLLTLASTVIAARMLGLENYGQLAILQSTLITFGVFAGLGVGMVATKFAAELKARDAVRLGKILALLRGAAFSGSVLIAAALAASADIVATRLMHMPGLAWMIVAGSVSIVFVTMDGYNQSVLLGLEALKPSVTAGLAAGLLSLPLSFLLIWLYELPGAIAGIVASSVLQWAISRSILNRILLAGRIAYGRRSLDEWKVLRDYALPALLGGAMVVPLHWICQVMLVNASRDATQIAILSIGLQWFQAVYFLPQSLGRIVLPVMTDVIANGQTQHAGIVLKSAIIANALVAVPLALVISLLSESIMALYGVKGAHAAIVLSLIAAAAALSATCAPVGQVMVAKGEIWRGWVMNLGWGAAYVGVSYLLLDFGAVGVAGGLLTAYLCHSLWVAVWGVRTLKSSAANRGNLPA